RGHDRRVGPEVVRRPGAHSVDARLATHAAGGGGVEVAGRVHLRGRYPGGEHHVDHVVRVRLLVAGAQLGGVHVVGAPDDALGEEEAEGKVEILAGGTHGDRQGAPGCPSGWADPDLQRLLDGDTVRTGPRTVGIDPQHGAPAGGPSHRTIVRRTRPEPLLADGNGRLARW